LQSRPILDELSDSEDVIKQAEQMHKEFIEIKVE
jgi:hypothetical protein